MHAVKARLTDNLPSEVAVKGIFLTMLVGKHTETVHTVIGKSQHAAVLALTLEDVAHRRILVLHTVKTLTCLDHILVGIVAEVRRALASSDRSNSVQAVIAECLSCTSRGKY